jgi:hypothetical protein
VTSITKGAAGIYTVNFTTALSSAVAPYSVRQVFGDNGIAVQAGTQSAAAYNYIIYSASAVATDYAHFFEVWQ